MSEVINAKFIPVYQPFFTGNEVKYVNQCFSSSWISSKGEFLKLFETNFAKYININHATTVANGTVALHLALYALGIGVGDEVIVPTFTYIASVNSIKCVGAKPIFVDSCKDSWNINPELIEEKITSKTKAIMIVHLYGNPCAMREIVNICQKYNLILIEDAAESFGSQYWHQYIGTFGHVSTFSFFGNKTITTGEGGMIVTKDSSLMDKIIKLKSQAVSPCKEYWHDEVGFNYRMTNICAAIGVAQLEAADNIIKKKRQLYEWYYNELKDYPIIFQSEDNNVINSYWMISFIVENNNIRNGIRNFLLQNGIETRPFFYPAHTMPMYRTNENYHVAEKLSACGLNLPSYPSLTRDEVIHICNLIKEYLSSL